MHSTKERTKCKVRLLIEEDEQHGLVSGLLLLD